MEYRIVPPKNYRLNLKELWGYRELFYFFTWRDIKVKYKQTYLGFSWAILQPFFLMIIFSLVFRPILKTDTLSVPYPLFVYMGLILWNIFSNGVLTAGNSMIQNAAIIKKIYFPRLIIPFSSVFISVFDFIMTLIPLILLFIYYKTPIDIDGLLWKLPVSIFLLLSTTLGIGTFLSALTVKYRDFRYIIPFLIQVLMFTSPILYTSSQIDNLIVRYFLQFNPISTAIELFRSIIVESYPISISYLTMNIGIALTVLIVGVVYFRKTEHFFADIS
ncbi:MAG: ABC transporter permease [Cytophagaceae bacterium]|jgi:lipopolysaccharide transport system permease protein|nr:ABC transporter permease [Cytophagaceae bacterium]